MADTEKRVTGAVKSSKQSVTNKIRFIARHRGLPVDEAWRKYAAPAVDAEFDRCAREEAKAEAAKAEAAK